MGGGEAQRYWQLPVTVAVHHCIEWGHDVWVSAACVAFVPTPCDNCDACCWAVACAVDALSICRRGCDTCCSEATFRAPDNFYDLKGYIKGMQYYSMDGA